MTKLVLSDPSLTGLTELQIALTQKGGPSEDGQLFEQILLEQEGILKSFGLPGTPGNEHLIWFESIPIETEVAKRIDLLQKTATEYLLSDAK
ncbi:hypothetical protein BH10BAC3_BH10BAC3_38740 [soil metagenome]